MQNVLMGLLGAQAAPGAAAQLQRLQQAGRQTYSSEMERRARANGFRNAAEMDLWIRQRNQRRDNPIGKQGPSGTPSPTPQGPQGITPGGGNILQYVLNRILGATGN